MNKNLNYRKLPQKPFKVVNMQYQNDRKMGSFCQSMLHCKSFEKTHHCALLRSVTNWHVYIFWFIFFLSYLFWTVYNLKSQYICPIQYHSYFEIFLVSIKVRHTDILHHSDDLKREKFDPSELQFRGGATMHCMYFLFFFFDEWFLKIF